MKRLRAGHTYKVRLPRGAGTVEIVGYQRDAPDREGGIYDALVVSGRFSTVSFGGVQGCRVPGDYVCFRPDGLIVCNGS